jgi:glycosyltransferase involved in cell wall biosynthesis
LQRYTVYPPVSALYALTEWTGRTDFPAASNSELTRRRVRGEHGIESQIVYPPVDVETFSTPVTADADVPPGRYALLSGRFVPFKKFEIGLERLGAVVDDGLLDTIVVAGRLDNTEYYDSLQEQFPFAEFWTDVPSEQWLALHQQADVYVFSNYEEDFGLTGAEAAASGTPVVSPCGPGISELLADWEHGYILDQELSGLSNSIKDIFATSSTVEPSSKIREECSIEVFTDRMLSL